MFMSSSSNVLRPISAIDKAVLGACACVSLELMVGTPVQMSCSSWLLYSQWMLQWCTLTYIIYVFTVF